MFRHLWQSIYSCNNYYEEAAKSKEADPPKYKQIRPILKIPSEKNNKYASDVETIKTHFGELKGGSITTTLQEMLVICPRKRPRIDSYIGLTNYLRREYNIELLIISNKSKQ